MKQQFRAWLQVTLVCLAVSARGNVPVVVAQDALPAVSLAAEDLSRCLTQIYPRETFGLTHALPKTGPAILIGTTADVQVRARAGKTPPSAPESYVVRTVGEGGLRLGVIAGADGRGAAYGAYALLRKLGCGFYLSYDAMPPARRQSFSFRGWSLEDAPLARERIVFEWHNFLSGCSTWNLPDWLRWTAQSEKMGFNAIMVHSYGNNPMAGFTFDGILRPVGYLATTIQGRDWNTMHVNDVRRLFGGEVFTQPVFGADAALVPDNQRVCAAQTLMQKVFADAARRDMQVYFAVDFDTVSANPQELVTRLPESARFEALANADKSTNKIWLPIADTPEGYALYRAEVEQLMRTYPQITTLVLWFRDQSTPFLGLTADALPPAWQKEFAAEIQRTPEAGKYWRAPAVFAVGKIVRAFDHALKECGANHTRLAVGSWSFEFPRPADRFLPSGVPLIALDYNLLRDKPQLGTAEGRAEMRQIAAHRPLIPVVWGQHDDGLYVGRSYTPLDQFASKLDDSKSAGFGLIHWTTRPLDLYFASLAAQVWKGSKDQPLSRTCRDFAARSFGAANRDVMGDCLKAWITGAPQFGRETSDFFIERRLTNVAQVVAGCRERLNMIDRASRSGLTPEENQRLDLQRGLEEFITAIYQAQGHFQDAQDLLAAGDLDGARKAVAQCHAEEVIERFAQSSSIGGITRGDQGLVVTMNTRWLPHVAGLRQALGMEPARFNFAPTSHEPLAQSPGTYTFYFDARHEIWETRGTEETGAPVCTLPSMLDDSAPQAWREIAHTGIETDKPLTLSFLPLMAKDSRHEKKTVLFLPGEYRLQLLGLDPDSTGAGQRVFDVNVADAPADRVDIFQRAGGSRRLVALDYQVALKSAGAVEVTLTPVKGKAILCGAVLTANISQRE